MVKAKRSKKPMADRVYDKKSSHATISNPFALAKPTKSMNPFEVHVNKEKFQILGRTCKHDKGLPGVSRAKAVKRRKQTLGLEYQVKHKSNRFEDRRIGKQLDQSELTDEVVNARFLADKLSEFKGNKTSKFNLNDDEILTHRGTTLEDIEQFRDDRSDDEDIGDEQLDADFIEAAHFGGGTEPMKDRKAAIDEMIIEQKKRKMESAKEKDALHDLTEKLDSNYKELMNVMGKLTKKGDKEKPPQDDFDKMMREMIFEPRSAVSDKLQSEEEVAKMEKERLERLENERIKRMLGDTDVSDDKGVPKHRSADDLDDGYCANGDFNYEENKMLSYNKEGKLDPKLKKYAKADKDDQDSENSESENEHDSDNETSEEEEDADSQSDASEDDLSDLKIENSDDENEVKTPKSKKIKTSKSKSEHSENGVSQLPFTIDMPLKYDSFLKLISKYNTKDQATIVERLIKCNHPKLQGVSRDNVVRLFAFLLQYIDELFGEAAAVNIAQNFELLHYLTPHLYDLMHIDAENMSTTLLEVIKEKYANYRKQPKAFPTLDTLVFLKLASNFYTTSDFRHPVVTPCFLFIEHVLSRARVRTKLDLSTGLFLLTIVLTYTQQSKRFLPACFNFLLGTLFLCVPKRTVELLKVVPPFHSQGPLSSLFVLNEQEIKQINAEKDDSEKLLKSEDLVSDEITSDFKIRALNMVLRLISEFLDVVNENVGANYFASPLLAILVRLPVQSYPKYVQKNFEKAKQALDSLSTKTLIKLVPPEKKPKALRLLEPRFEAVYDDKRRPKMSEKKVEKAKLMHKIKRETKGAVREIRRDTEFVQKMRIQQQIQSDRERHEKVKRIFHEASIQQGELNELARAKKKKKF